MRLIRNPELKGILALLGIAAVLALILLAMTGKVTEWTGWRFTLAKPLTNAIVYVSDKNGHSDIWTMSPDGAGKKALTNDTFEDSEPVVSPDGYTIVFISKHEGSYNQIYAMDADGSHLHRLTQMTGAKSGPSFSKDGKEIMFLCAGSVWTVGINEEHTERILPTEQQEKMEQNSTEPAPFVWARRSYDGTSIAAVRTQKEGSAVYLIKTGEAAPQVVPVPQPSDGSHIVPEHLDAAWSPDSAELLMAMDSGDGKNALVIVDLANPQMSADAIKSAIGSPEWSPDGSRKIVCQKLERKGPNYYVPTGLFVFQLAGGQPIAVPSGEPMGPRWSPDASTVVFADGGKICVADAASGKVTTLSDGKSRDSEPAWAPAEAKK